jgi:hypothetical protein
VFDNFTNGFVKPVLCSACAILRSQNVTVKSETTLPGSRCNSSTTNKPKFYATHRLLLGASPLKVRKCEWKCSQECKNKKKLANFRDSQAVEKHILRHHPDPVYNQFVCMICDMKKTSPQQILDHIGQSVNVGGHAVRGQALKNEYLKGINKDTNNLFR